MSLFIRPESSFHLWLSCYRRRQIGCHREGPCLALLCIVSWRIKAAWNVTHHTQHVWRLKRVDCSKLHKWWMDVLSSLQVVYVMRNPKDVFTSSFHLHDIVSFLVKPGTQSEFLHKFLDGKGCSHYNTHHSQGEKPSTELCLVLDLKHGRCSKKNKLWHVLWHVYNAFYL